MVKKGRGREKERGKGKGKEKNEGIKNKVEKWEGGEGNQVSGNFIHP